jgi:hypothetical protein
MKALAYREIFSDSASVETDQSLTGDGTEDHPLSVESAPRVEDGVYQIMFSKGIMTIQGIKPDDGEEEDWDHVVYQHDLSSDPFAQPSDLVEVYHDESLFGKGTSMIPLSLKPQTDGSIAGHGTITKPLSLAIQHDTILEGLESVESPLSVNINITDTLNGPGSEESPLTVISAPIADVAESVIMILDNNQALYFDKDSIKINGKLADGTDFDYEWPLDKDPFSETIYTDSTLQGTGFVDWPLTVVSAPTAALANRASTADKIQDGANILQLTDTQIEILGMHRTQLFAYAAPLTTNPFFLGITTDSTLTGDGS